MRQVFSVPPGQLYEHNFFRGLVNDFVIAAAVTLPLLLLAFYYPAPHPDQSDALSTFAIFAMSGVGCLVSSKTLLRWLLPLFTDYPLILRPVSQSPSVRVFLWLLFPRNAVAPYGLVVLLSAIMALFQQLHWPAHEFPVVLYALFPAPIMIFGALQLRIERSPSTTLHILLGTGPQTVHRLLWLAAVCVIAALIVLIGMNVMWPVELTPAIE